MVPSRFDRYRTLTAKLGREQARALIDRLQVLALTEPDAVTEMEAFLERGGIRRGPSEREPRAATKPVQP
jgi:hypothetical protein